MDVPSKNVELLIDEYLTYVSESMMSTTNGSKNDWNTLYNRLCEWGNWTPQGAEAVIQLARENGAFMLRNAMALSIALGIEDGENGY